MTGTPNEPRIHIIRARSIRRARFCAMVFTIYAAFVLQYTGLRDFFALTLGDDTLINVSMAFFCSMIVLFLLLEQWYIRSREREDRHE